MLTGDQTGDHPFTTVTVDAATIAGDQFHQLGRAWNRADGAEFGALFADEADFVDIRGAHHRGAIDIGEGHQAIFDTIYAGSSVAYHVEMARMIGPGSVLAIVAATLAGPRGLRPGINSSRITALLTDEGDRWTITALQNTLVQECT